MNSLEEQISQARSSAILFELDNAAVFRISGIDAERYLQGRITQDVKKLTPGEGAQSLLLSPQGKVRGLFTLLRNEDSFLLILDRGLEKEHAAEFVESLLMFKVADQLEVENLSSSLSLISVQGQECRDALARTGFGKLPEGRFSHCRGEVDGLSVTMLHSHRGPFTSFDILLDRSDCDKFIASIRTAKGSQLARGSENARNLLRLVSLIPEYGIDLDEKVSATDIPIDNLVSFEKGCYAGQEVVEMSIARGRPNRRLQLFEAEKPISQGAELNLVGAEKPLGRITTSVELPSRNICFAIGFLKTSVAPSEELTCDGKRVRQISPADVSF